MVRGMDGARASARADDARAPWVKLEPELHYSIVPTPGPIRPIALLGPAPRHRQVRPLG